MITQLLQKDNKEIYEMISKNSSAKSKLKQIENTWKQIEQLIKKDLQKTLKGGK
jgi:hypothetical protein